MSDEVILSVAKDFQSIFEGIGKRIINEKNGKSTNDVVENSIN